MGLNFIYICAIEENFHLWSLLLSLWQGLCFYRPVASLSDTLWQIHRLTGVSPVFCGENGEMRSAGREPETKCDVAWCAGVTTEWIKDSCQQCPRQVKQIFRQI